MPADVDAANITARGTRAAKDKASEKQRLINEKAARDKARIEAAIADADTDSDDDKSMNKMETDEEDRDDDSRSLDAFIDKDVEEEDEQDASFHDTPASPQLGSPIFAELEEEDDAERQEEEEGSETASQSKKAKQH